MAITLTISDPLAIVGATAAAAAYNAAQPDLPEGGRPPELTPQQYLEQCVGEMCMSYRDQFAVDRVTSSAFVFRFTSAEYAAILNAAKTDPVLGALVADVDSSPYVWLGAQKVVDGVNYCASLGLLTTQRAAEILAF